MNQNCLASNIVYEATITCDLPNYYGTKKYICICETTFKKRFASHNPQDIICTPKVERQYDLVNEVLASQRDELKPCYQLENLNRFPQTQIHVSSV